MTTRKIDFPDVNDPGFNPDEPFEADNGITYVYNGWGWDIVCKGGSTVEEYDDQWIRDDQKRQDERIEELAQQGQTCDSQPDCKVNPSGPPFVGNRDFNVSGDVIHIASGIFDHIKPEVGNTLRISGDSLSEDWSSVITIVGEKYSPPTGHHVYDLTVEDAFPPEIANAPASERFTISSCEAKFVTKSEFEEDQKRQDDELDTLANPCYTVSGIAHTVQDGARIVIKDVATYPGQPLKTDVILPVSMGAKPYEAETLTINGDEYEIIAHGGEIFGLIDYFLEGHHQSKYEGKNVDVTVCNPDTVYVTHAEFEEDQQRQDDALEEVDQASKARDLLLEAEILALASQLNGKQRETFINSTNPGDNPYPGYKVKDDKTFTFNYLPWDPLPRVGDKLQLIGEQYASQEIVAVSSLYQESGPYTLIDVTVQWGVFGLENAQVGDEAEFELVSGSREYVTHDELAEDQKRQDDEIEAIKDSLDYCIVDEEFYVRSQMEFTNTVVFGGNYIEMPDNIELAVGDKLNVAAGGDEESYTVTAVSEVIPAPGGAYVTDYRRYSLAESVTVSWIMKGSVHITSCTYPWDEAVDTDNLVHKSGDTMTGDLFVEADVHANRIDSRIIDSGEQSNLNLQWNGNTKVYVGKDEVTIQPPLQLNTEGTDPNHAVTKGYIDSLDAKQAAEIDTIEYKLDALVGLTFKGTYEFKHDQSCEEEYQECMANCVGGDARCEQDCLRDYSTCEQNNVDPGFFEAVDPGGQFDNLQEIIISKNDKSNVEVDWAGVLDKDDYLEVDHVLMGQLDKTNYGLYRIIEEPEEKTNGKGEVVYVMKLQFLQGDGVLNESELYEIRGITAAEGVNPEELADFLTKDDAKALYAPIDHNHNTTYATKTHSHSGSDITSGTVSINRLPVGTSSSTVARGDHTHSNSGGFIKASHGYKTSFDSNQGASGSGKWMAKSRSYTDGHLSNSATYDSFKRLGQITFRGNDSGLIGKCGQVGTLVASTTSDSSNYVYLVFQIYKHTSGTSSGVKWDTFTGVITWMREKDRPENDATSLGDSQQVYWTWHGEAA